jgi:hypothetical protein
LAWRERAVSRLLTETAQAGDVVVFAEVSCMARSTLQILKILEHSMTGMKRNTDDCQYTPL